MVKNPPANEGDTEDAGLFTGWGRSAGGGNGNPQVFLLEKSHGQRSPVSYSPQGHKELDTTRPHVLVF